MPDKSANMSQPQDWRLIVEKDVPIKLRDGGVIYCDVLRPDCDEKVPALMNMGPYQKTSCGGRRRILRRRRIRT